MLLTQMMIVLGVGPFISLQMFLERDPRFE